VRIYSQWHTKWLPNGFVLFSVVWDVDFFGVCLLNFYFQFERTEFAREMYRQ